MNDKAFNIVKNPKFDEYQRGLVSMAYKLFDKKTSDSDIVMENMSEGQLAEELHKSVIRKFKKKEVQSPFIDNIWGAYMQSISKFNRRHRFLLCAIDIAYMHGLFLWQIKKVLQLPFLFWKF